MSSNVIFFSWSRPNPGREQQGAELFQEFLHYFGKLQQEKTIQSFEPVLLNPNTGDVNGFFLIRGEGSKLDALQAGEEWQTLVARSLLCLEKPSDLRGVTGDEVRKRMELWTRVIR